MGVDFLTWESFLRSERPISAPLPPQVDCTWAEPQWRALRERYSGTHADRAQGETGAHTRRETDRQTERRVELHGGDLRQHVSTEWTTPARGLDPLLIRAQVPASKSPSEHVFHAFLHQQELFLHTELPWSGATSLDGYVSFHREGGSGGVIAGTEPSS